MDMSYSKIAEQIIKKIKKENFDEIDELEKQSFDNYTVVRVYIESSTFNKNPLILEDIKEIGLINSNIKFVGPGIENTTRRCTLNFFIGL